MSKLTFTMLSGFTTDAVVGVMPPGGDAAAKGVPESRDWRHSRHQEPMTPEAPEEVIAADYVASGTDGDTKGDGISSNPL